jgi:hypothetical protein
MGSEASSKGPVLFWCGVAVAEFGAVQPGYGQAWQPAAYAGAALLVALGLIVVRYADHLRSEQAGRRLRLAAYLAGTLLVAYHLSSASPSPVTVTALLVYGVASVMAVWSHGGTTRTKGTLLIATDLEPGTLRTLLADRGQSIVAVYRTERITDELRELQERYGLVLVVGQEHDPRAKERLSASGLSRQVPDIADREVLLAGPRHFTRYVRGALSRLAVPGTQVRTASVRLRQRA